MEGRFPGPELKGALDFSEVGLLGHSVGGEAVRAAYDLYQFGGDLSNVWSTKIRDAITFRGIFEIAPEDGVAQGQGGCSTHLASTGTCFCRCAMGIISTFRA